ncbi:Holliday junction resolvase RuvX [archaeon]|nr:Holliday junction resolvase RuvX [archaeon]
MGRILAIDYGRKRTGLAVTDELQIIATSLGTVSTAQVMVTLKRYCSENKVERFVVGEPKDLMNRPSEAEHYIAPFVRQLRKEFPEVPVERIDERFTSKIAQRTILEAGLKKSDRRDKALVDQVSATIILQSYLEARSMRS